MRRRTNAMLIIFVALFIIAAIFSTQETITGFAPHATDNRFSAAHDVSHQLQSLTVKDGVIYKQAWYSIDGGPWQGLSLQGTTYPNAENWLVGTASTESLPSAITEPGEHYLITYSCSQAGATWDCHGGKWQLETITVEAPPGENCSDGEQNQDETGIDCGGSTCGACTASFTKILYAINAGGDAYTAADGTHYAADIFYSGGTPYDRGSIPVAGTEDDYLYSTERYGAFSYSIPITDGTYEVTIKLMEGYFTATNARVFDVHLEGETIIDDLDLFETVGHDMAYDQTFTVQVTDGTLDITVNQEVNNPEICAILVKGSESTPSCTDQEQNGDETGIDCGGPCPSCTVCTPKTTSKCYGDDVYWFDSCNQPGTIKEPCDNACAGSACIETCDDCTSYLIGNGLELDGLYPKVFRRSTHSSIVSIEHDLSYEGDYSLRLACSEEGNGYTSSDSGEEGVVFTVTELPVTLRLETMTYTKDGSGGYISIFCLGDDYYYSGHDFKNTYNSNSFTTNANTWTQQMVEHTCDDPGVKYVGIRLAGNAGKTIWYDNPTIHLLSGSGMFPNHPNLQEPVPEPTCNDYLMNGYEEGIDCGGPCAKECGPRPGKVMQYLGVNLAAAEFNHDNVPGIYGKHYPYPTEEEVDYFMAKGMNTFRLHFKWERFQKQAYADLDLDEVARMDSFVKYAGERGAYTVFSVFNSMRYYSDIVGETVEVDVFTNFWTQMAEHYKNNEYVIFGLMNEPHKMDGNVWISNANAAMQAIRATGAENLILVAGNDYGTASSWCASWNELPNCEGMLDIVDPGNNFAFEPHQYIDSNHAGKVPECQSPSSVSTKLVTVTEWAREHGYTLFLGEFGAGTSSDCLEGLDVMMTYMEDNDDIWLGWTYWAAGPWWSDSYFTSIEPDGGEDKPQMAVIEPHLTYLRS